VFEIEAGYVESTTLADRVIESSSLGKVNNVVDIAPPVVLQIVAVMVPVFPESLLSAFAQLVPYLH